MNPFANFTRPVFASELERFVTYEFYCIGGTWYLEEKFPWKNSFEYPEVWSFCDRCKKMHAPNSLTVCDMKRALEYGR